MNMIGSISLTEGYLHEIQTPVKLFIIQNIMNTSEKFYSEYYEIIFFSKQFYLI